MCNIADIIVIDQYKHNGQVLDKHSFVVLDNSNGKIRGCDYNLLCNVMSSFKSEKHKKSKMRYAGNFPVVFDDVDVNGNQDSGYIKADQLYYFDSKKINYIVIGNLKIEIFNLLIEFIQELEINIEEITDNL